jgi:hypothetical protein
MAILLLSAYAALIGGDNIVISTIFQVFAANIVIHAGLAGLQRLECKSIALETVLNMLCTVFVVVAFGAASGWFRSTPVGVLIIMTVAVYLAGLLLSIFRAREEAKAINSLLRLRDKHNK